MLLIQTNYGDNNPEWVDITVGEVKIKITAFNRKQFLGKGNNSQIVVAIDAPREIAKVSRTETYLQRIKNENFNR